ncbi:MAG: hypothetical protein ACRD6X_20390, partial [Pyrinomonadaceae bacterium]
GYSGYIPTNATYIGGGRIQPVGYGGPPRFSPSRGNSPPDTNIGQLNGVTDLSERDLLQDATQQHQTQSHDNPMNDLKSFLKKNPECLNALGRIGISKSAFLDLMENVQHIDASQNAPELDMTMEQLGIPGDTQAYLTSTLRQVRDKPVLNQMTEALTNWKGNAIYYFGPFYALNKIGRGGTTFHEGLHKLFNGGHEVIANRLGIKHGTAQIRVPVGDVTAPGPVKYEIVDLTDGLASAALQEWIKKGCK